MCDLRTSRFSSIGLQNGGAAVSLSLAEPRISLKKELSQCQLDLYCLVACPLW